MLVKIFATRAPATTMGLQELEREINEWLKDRRNVEIQNITITSSGEGAINIICLIVFKIALSKGVKESNT